jgi:hypothetical protein
MCMMDIRSCRHRRSWRTLATALLAVATIASLVPGCSGRRTHRPPSHPAADTLANGLPRVLAPGLADWVRTWRPAIPGLEPDSLQRGATSTFRFGYAWPGAAGRPRDNVRSRAGVDVLSPDSTRSLDFDMYLDFERAGDGVIEFGREPDSAPVLADFRSDTLWQVAFCGPSCFYDGAYWLDANRFALSGATQTGEQADGPWQGFIEVYDLRARCRTGWTTRSVDYRGFTRYQASRDSALSARLERARFERSSPEAGSRVPQTDSSP